MNKSNNSVSRGIGFFGLLQVAFIVLKLCGVINWSWAIVLIPLWIDIALTLIVIIVLIILYKKM